MTSLALMMFVLVLALWQKSLFLYMMASPLCVVYGLGVADGHEIGSALFVGGVVIIVIGVYCLVRAALIGFGLIKGR